MRPYDRTARILDNVFVSSVLLQLGTLLIALPLIIVGALRESPFLVICGGLAYLIPMVGFIIMKSAIRRWFEYRKPGVEA